MKPYNCKPNGYSANEEWVIAEQTAQLLSEQTENQE